ncbi:MAG: polysaccharide deacetylase family protein [Natrialbaceae archaeon]|nr:polysaccharide deacetylase family protein [Natrialbaceae archaeon]
MGSVVLSIDAELGWGFHDLQSPPIDRIESGRRGWTRLIELLEAYDVPATWGIVGHLMLDTCDGRHEAHPTPDNWFAQERTRWKHREDLRFAPALVQRLLQSPVDHEVACHSFSHVEFDRETTTRDIAAAEIERSLEIASEWGLHLNSFIFPRNGVGHREVLADYGLQTYRGPSTGSLGLRRMVAGLLDEEALLVTPTVDEYGLVNVPASLFLFGFERPWRSIVKSVWRDPMVACATRGIEHAARSDGVCHLWLHPNNLVGRYDDDRMKRILEVIDTQRNEHGLRVETMGAVSQRTEATIEANPENQTAEMLADGG